VPSEGAASNRIRHWYQAALARIRRWERKPRYWIRAWIAIGLGIGAGILINQGYLFLDLRYQVYRELSHLLPDRDPMWTAVVLIGDDEYWNGRLAHRTPIKRDYLAVLLRRLDLCDPYVIGLDFDLRSPATDGSLPDNPEYSGETAALVDAVLTVSPHHPIVLPVTLASDKSRVEPSVLDSIPDRTGEVARGSIAAPYDYREIPTAEILGDYTVSRSFALVAANFVHPSLASRFPPDAANFPFGSLNQSPRFPTFPYTESTGFTPHVCKALRHKVVLVGAGWHTKANHRGDLVDSHLTPIGTVSGVFLHANYVEAFLGSRTYRRLGDAWSVVFEALFSLAIALVLASRISHLAKFATALFLSSAILLVTYVFAQNFGVFGDFFAAAGLLFVHAFYSYWEDLEHDAHLLHKLPSEEIAKLEAS
jgi:CHASE2 domain-containing sensor protein